MGWPKFMEETNPRSRHSGKTLNTAAHVRRRFSIRADLLAERARVQQDSGNRQ